jgi:hypothetical protein
MFRKILVAIPATRQVEPGDLLVVLEPHATA